MIGNLLNLRNDPVKSPMAALFLFGALFLSNPSALAQEEAVVAFLKLSPAGSFEARTNRVEGVARKKGSGFVAVGVKVPLETLKTKMDLRDEHMKDKYLETKKFPHAELVSAEGSGGKGTGKLKIKGIEKPISGTYEVVDGGKKIKAEFEISLSEYGITGIRYMGVGVKDKVKLNVTLPVQ